MIKVIGFLSVFILLVALLIPSTIFSQSFSGYLAKCFLGFIPESFVYYVDDYINSFQKKSAVNQGDNIKVSEYLFTKDELWKHYRGISGSRGVYVGFLGKVYDVKNGAKYYQAGGSYHFFAGRDATRAFITGDFSEDGLIDDLGDVDLHNFAGINDWEKFYAKNYPVVGKVVGYFYDSSGKPTSSMKNVQESIKKALKVKEEEKSFDLKMPACNSMSSQEHGSKVWCSKKSGGITRDWIGVPRLFLAPGTSTPRCVCVRTKGSSSFGLDTTNGDLSDARIKPYPGCDPLSEFCITST